jgi:hypothetical protein
VAAHRDCIVVNKLIDMGAMVATVKLGMIGAIFVERNARKSVVRIDMSVVIVDTRVLLMTK